MRTVVYSKPFLPQMGGLERNTLTLCSALSDLGHDTTLITETKSTTEERYPFRIIRTRSLHQVHHQLRNADLFITNGGNVPLRASLPAVLQGIPYGIIYHGFRGFGKEGTGIAARFKSIIRRKLARGALFNVFTSTHSKNVTDVPDESAYVVLNPVGKELEKLYCDGGEEAKASGPFLFAGRLIEGKGIFVLAEALEHLDGMCEIELVVAGEGQDEDRFRNRVRGLETVGVTMAGRLGASKLVPLYQCSKALLVPTTTHQEGNPLVIAEALYGGTPVIASDQPPMIESVGDAGIIVKQGDAEALAKAIRRLEFDESYNRLLQGAAKKRGKKTFGYGQYKEKIRNIIQHSV